MRIEAFQPIMQALGECTFPTNEVTAKVYKFMEKLDEQLANDGFDPVIEVSDAAGEVQEALDEYYEEDDDDFEIEDEDE